METAACPSRAEGTRRPNQQWFPRECQPREQTAPRRTPAAEAAANWSTLPEDSGEGYVPLTCTSLSLRLRGSSERSVEFVSFFLFFNTNNLSHLGKQKRSTSIQQNVRHTTSNETVPTTPTIPQSRPSTLNNPHKWAALTLDPGAPGWHRGSSELQEMSTVASPRDQLGTDSP